MTIIMKPLSRCFALIAAALLSSCASYTQPLVLDSVGPRPLETARPNSTGSLVVYSAVDIHPDFTAIDPDLRKYTDYKIFSEDGKLLKKVRNNAGSMWETPVEVPLEPGTYRVVAQAAGYSLVTVPVVVAARRTTIVHLDGPSAWPRKSFNETNTLVHLPNGQIVGWRAIPENPTSGTVASH